MSCQQNGVIKRRRTSKLMFAQNKFVLNYLS